MRPSGPSRTRPSPCHASLEVAAEEELRTLLDRTEGERPWQIRDELAETMHENFGVFRREDQMLEQGEIVAGLRERYERVVVEDKGDVFNSDLTQALELGIPARARRRAWSCQGSRARRAAARTRDRTTTPTATTRTSSEAHARDLGGRRAASSTGSRSTMTKWQPRSGRTNAMMALKIWRYDPNKGERALREYEVDAPDWATLLDVPRHRQGPATTARSPTARAAG